MAPRGRFQLSRRQLPVAIAAAYAAMGTLWILFSDRLVHDAMGQTVKGLGYVAVTAVLAWWVVHRGVAQVAAAEVAQAESESRYRQIFEKTTSVCLLVDVDSLALVDVNPAAVLFYGWSRDELIGKSLVELNTVDLATLREMVRAAEEERRNFFVFRHRLRSGAVRDVEMHSSPIVLNVLP